MVDATSVEGFQVPSWIKDSFFEICYRLQEFDLTAFNQTAKVTLATKYLTDQWEFVAEAGKYMLHQDWFFFVIIYVAILVAVIYYCLWRWRSINEKQKLELAETSSTLSVFDIAKTAYEPGHVDALIELVEKRQFNINYPLPNSGLTLFLCACLSGQRKLVNFLLGKGANVHSRTQDGDSALYLATFGVMNMTDAFTLSPDVELLNDLIQAGCSVNSQNSRGYSPLHRAASRGNVQVIRCLLDHGADPYLCTVAGVYPVELAANAGHMDAAELLSIDLDDQSVWDIIEPHTPARVRLGLQSPGKKHLAESTNPKAGRRLIREI